VRVLFDTSAIIPGLVNEHVHHLGTGFDVWRFGRKGCGSAGGEFARGDL
jgi:hypothetical protein